MTTSLGPVKRRLALVIFDSFVGPSVQQEPGHAHVAPEARNVEGGPAVFVWRVDVGGLSKIQQIFDDVEVTVAAGCVKQGVQATTTGNIFSWRNE